MTCLSIVVICLHHVLSRDINVFYAPKVNYSLYICISYNYISIYRQKAIYLNHCVFNVLLVAISFWIYIVGDIQLNSVRIRFLSWQFFCLSQRDLSARQSLMLMSSILDQLATSAIYIYKYWSYISYSGCGRMVQGGEHKVLRLVLQCTIGVSSNPVEGRTKFVSSKI
jgi:hypothetical protein